MSTLFAVHSGGIVTELFDHDPGFHPDMQTDVSKIAGITIGWKRKSDGTFSAPPPPALMVPKLISRRQFFQQLALTPNPSNKSAMIITQDEALAAMGGTIPAVLENLISALPAGDQFGAKMLVAGADFDRGAALTEEIGEAFGMTSAQIDEFWIAAFAL